MKRMIKQAHMASKRSGPIYKFSVQIPRNQKEAREVDKKYLETIGKVKWGNSEITKIGKLHEYKSFKDHSHARKGFPKGYLTI